jgi:hypothetical protein
MFRVHTRAYISASTGDPRFLQRLCLTWCISGQVMIEMKYTEYYVTFSRVFRCPGFSFAPLGQLLFMIL